jgi:hypothetical protein
VKPGKTGEAGESSARPLWTYVLHQLERTMHFSRDCSTLELRNSPQVVTVKARATLAQLVERLIRNQQVAGSIPAGGSIKHDIRISHLQTDHAVMGAVFSFQNCPRHPSLACYKISVRAAVEILEPFP